MLFTEDHNQLILYTPALDELEVWRAAIGGTVGILKDDLQCTIPSHRTLEWAQISQRT